MPGGMFTPHTVFTRLVAACCLLCVIVLGRGGRADDTLRKLYNHRIYLPTRDPLIIAHRGASGQLPEHTLEAYRLAIEQGADVIECDLSVTSDLHLVCLHDSWLSTTTNVNDVFPAERKMTYDVADLDDPHLIEDYFAPDFTLAELKTLRKIERFPHRNQNYNGEFQIATLEEFIQVAKEAAPQIIGIAPEIKNPVFLNAHPTLRNAKVTVHDLLLPVLDRHGYGGARDACFVQSFHWDTLVVVSARTELPLVYLFSKEQTEISQSELTAAAQICHSIGPHKHHILTVDDNNNIVARTDLVARAHALGLKVIPYTFRNDDAFLAHEYGKDPAFEILDFMRLGVDGYFTDFPRTVKHVFNQFGIASKSSSQCGKFDSP